MREAALDKVNPTDPIERNPTEHMSPYTDDSTQGCLSHRSPHAACVTFTSTPSHLTRPHPQAEAEKILSVKAAEADAESKYLSGVGVTSKRPGG